MKKVDVCHVWSATTSFVADVAQHREKKNCHLALEEETWILLSVNEYILSTTFPRRLDWLVKHELVQLLAGFAD